MEQPIVNFILGRLSALSDDELINLDFESALAIMNDGLSDSERQQLRRIFTRIQSELGVRHHGVKGMKWGVRRYQNKDGSLTEAGKRRAADANAKSSIFGTAQPYSIKTRSGESISVQPLKPPSTVRKIWDALMGTSNAEMGTRGDANYTLSDSSGNKIGQLSLISKSVDVAYIDWITVDEKHRGKGYATDVLNDLIGKARESGYSRIELNALKKPRPLYERLGFTYRDQSNDSIITRISEFELGTKRMEYNLRGEIMQSEHMMNTIYTIDGRDFELRHYGVKGMRWGHRKKRSAAENAARTNRAVSAGRAISSAVKGDLTGAAYYARRSRMYNKAVKDLKGEATTRETKNQPRDKARKDKSVADAKKFKKAAAKGAKATANALTKIGAAYVVDQMAYGGAGTKIVKSALRAVGMAAITGYTMARGGYDIKWYNKDGKRVG